jgi:hypothetical protein
MTLIVGILCSDGIVMGADGAATLGSFGNDTVRQPVKKLTAIGNSLIVGVSGPVGLGQIFVGIELLWSDRHFSNKRPHEAMTTIRDKLWPHVATHFQAAATAAPVLGAPLAVKNTLSQSIVAIPIAREACLSSSTNNADRNRQQQIFLSLQSVADSRSLILFWLF